MAEYKSYYGTRNYLLSNGQTVDLIALIGSYRETKMDWVSPVKAPEVGTVAYVDAMGDMRRGVVVKTTQTKTYVAVTTQGAVDAAVRTNSTIRVQTVIADHNWVRVAPPAAEDPEEFTAEAIEEDINREVAKTLAAAQLTEVQEHTGSTVISLLERVWDRIREDHPELPQVVIVTGSGEGAKWGHFRADSWKVREEGAATHQHELFLASEALAKGAHQVLQTMLHEAAHTMAKVRDVKDTSRQGRWHNQVFRRTAEEMGLKHQGAQADRSHGFAFVTLTQATKDRYADLLAELDREIRLTGQLPTWLGGTDGGDDDKGGERMTKPPAGQGSGEHSGSLKLTCMCEQPNIIRASRKVADKLVVRCDDCQELFGQH